MLILFIKLFVLEWTGGQPEGKPFLIANKLASLYYVQAGSLEGAEGNEE